MPIGRPTILDRELIGKLPRLVRKYSYISTIADKLGCDRRTMQLWAKEGQRINRRMHRLTEREEGRIIELTNRDELRLDFFRTLVGALADLEASLLRKVRTLKQWLPHWYELKARKPTHYGRLRNLDSEAEDELRAIREERRRQSRTVG